MNITKVEIKNFEGHEDSVVHFTNGVNILVGSSNSGKSSILKAIDWCLNNRPSGTHFISSFAKQASVIVHGDNGYKVERTRSRTAANNYYRLYSNDVLQQEFTGFGTGVPELIREATEIDDSEFNYSKQMEAPFLISDKPKARGERIGNLEGLQIIEEAISGTNAEIKEYDTETRTLTKQLKELDSEMNILEKDIDARHDNTERLKVIVAALEERAASKERVTSLVTTLSELNNKVTDLREGVAVSQRVSDSFIDLDERINNVKSMSQNVMKVMTLKSEIENVAVLASSEIDNLTELTNKVDALIKTVSNIERINERMAAVQKAIKNNETTVEETLTLDFTETDLRIEKFAKVNNIALSYTENLRQQSELYETQKRCNENIEKLLNEFVQAIQEEKVCPTCSQDTTNVDVNLIKQNI